MVSRSDAPAVVIGMPPISRGDSSTGAGGHTSGKCHFLDRLGGRGYYRSGGRMAGVLDSRFRGNDGGSGNDGAAGMTVRAGMMGGGNGGRDWRIFLTVEL